MLCNLRLFPQKNILRVCGLWAGARLLFEHVALGFGALVSAWAPYQAGLVVAGFGPVAYATGEIV